MRRSSIISALLVLVFAGSAFNCAAGLSNIQTDHCSRKGHRSNCGTKASATATKGCRSVKSLPSQCSLRSFAQFHAVELHRFEVPNPLRHADGKTLRPDNSGIIISSIGSPETDRGPPGS